MTACTRHPFGETTGLTCTGDADHDYGCTYIATGGGVDAEAGGDEGD